MIGQRRAEQFIQVDDAQRCELTQALAIMSTIQAREFCLAVSMSDFVTWFGDGDDDFSENESLRAALKTLGVTVDLCGLYVSYFEFTSIGTGDVHVYQSTDNSRNIFSVDLYRDLTDQMDIVSFFVGCDDDCLPIVRDKLRSFFDRASCQVKYEEASYLPRFHGMIDEGAYPVIIDQSGYKQKIHRAYG